MDTIKNFNTRENTNGFDKNPNNINRNGRPKKIYNVLIEKGYSHDDIKTAFGELAWYTKNELNEVVGDEKKPMITRIVANQFTKALKKSDWTKIKDILEHIIGKAPQEIKQNTITQLNVDPFKKIRENAGIEIKKEK